MKKLLTFFVLILVMVFMVGCENYGELVDVAFYNLDNEEIEGEYRDLDDIYDENKNKSILSSSFKKKPMNSPSIRNMYYYADINKGDTIIVRFKLKCNETSFYSLDINRQTIYKNEFEKVEIIDNFTYIYYKCTNIESSNNEYIIQNLIVETDYKNYKHQADRSYGEYARISGFYFNVI